LNEDYRKLANLDRDHAYREIQDLIAMGVVQSSGAAGRGAVYYPSPHLLETRAWLESRIPKLKAYFKAHEQIDNTEYRRLFDVTRFAATRDLKRLVEESFLNLLGTRRGSYYVEGSALAKTPGK
jgi:predicted HTH transcriptional regulator